MEIWPFTEKNRNRLFDAIDRILYCQCEEPQPTGRHDCCQRCGGVIREKAGQS